jgi:hypothetical protein
VMRCGKQYEEAESLVLGDSITRNLESEHGEVVVRN